MHKHTEIRNQIVSILDTVDTDASVFNYRFRPMAARDMPAIAVYTDTETVEKTAGEGLYIRSVNVIIALYATGKDRINPKITTGDKPVDEKIDDLKTYVEGKLLTQYQDLNNTVYRFNYDGISSVTAEPLGENGITLVVFTNWVARYHENLSAS